jgi:hypothetical protein
VFALGIYVTSIPLLKFPQRSEWKTDFKFKESVISELAWFGIFFQTSLTSSLFFFRNTVKIRTWSQRSLSLHIHYQVAWSLSLRTRNGWLAAHQMELATSEELALWYV